MSDYDLELLDRYRRKCLLVDTNLLLLDFIGSYDRELISKFKRTRNFLDSDYDLIVLIRERFTQFVTTPNILTEVNSFTNQLASAVKEDYFTIYANRIAQLQEVYVPSSEIAQTHEFRVYGLTDAVIVRVAREHECLVVTIDGRLAAYLSYIGIGVINFNDFSNFFQG